MGGGQSAENTQHVSINSKVDQQRQNMVIIPVDQSKQAEAAFLWYARHIHKEGNTVQVIHCQEWPPESSYSNAETLEQGFQRAREEGISLIEEYQHKLEAYEIPGSVHFEFGNAGVSIVNAADRLKASHIVIGSRGFGIVRRTILGSVSEYVIHHSHIPVTVVPKETQSWFF